MKWTTRALTCSALLALAATAMLGRLLQQPGAGAAAAPRASETKLASLAQPAAVHEQAAAAAPPKANPAASPVSTAAPPAPHFSYVGHWTNRGRTQVMLQRGSASFTVQGPGRLDDSYEVLAITEKQLTLLHRVSGTRHLLVFDAARSAAVPGGSAAGQAGVAVVDGAMARGLQRALPVGAVPPAHAPANSRGDTEDQQETN